jgi:hypothetical protein
VADEAGRGICESRKAEEATRSKHQLETTRSGGGVEGAANKHEFWLAHLEA